MTMDMPKIPENLVVERLRSSAVFGGLSESILERLATSLEPVSFAAGDCVVAEGDAATDAFILITGRLQVSALDETGEPAVVAELAPGNVVGEMSLLTGEPRSATVHALRDSLTLRLHAADFQRIVLDEPSALLELTRTIVRRLDRSIHGRRPVPSVRVVGVLPAGRTALHHDFASRFADAVGGRRSVALVTSAQLERHLGANATRATVATYLHQIERDHALTLLVADDALTGWTQRCVRQADVNLLVGEARELGVLSAAEAAVRESVDAVLPETHLVILHESGRPTRTPAVLALRKLDRFHHVRRRFDQDLDRLARIVTGTSVGLVLGGGGARGYAHFGVIRALAEARVPVDHVGGASIGASVAAGLAMGLDWETMLDHERAVTADNALVDLSFPAVALARGRRLTAGARANYGQAHIEDLWAEFFCVSTDLTTGTSRVHTTGPVWRAVRASTSIPGIFPPVRGPDGHVLVDGAVLNNLPADVMANTFRPGTVLAVDLEGPSSLPASDLPDDGVLNGWRVLGRRLAPWLSPLEIPHMVDLLTRTSSVSRTNGAQLADLVIRPPVSDFGTLDFDAYRRIADAGYREAVEVLDQWEELSHYTV